MIPVTLQLQNFLSYGRDVEPLDFTQFNIASLSGGNGQGKSALLDALTWALWGEGRKAQQEKKADRGLLKIGENQMWVDLVIELEGERYRIIRKFSLIKKKSHSELELMVFDDKKNDYIPLTAPSLRQTQQKINTILRMDYNTFINSAFILQGRVDEFTRKGAMERKQILSEVLGLSHYESLSVLARKKAKDFEREIIALNASISQFLKDISQKDIVTKEIKEIEEAEGKQLELIKAKQIILQKLLEEEQRISYDRRQVEEVGARISVELTELQELEKRKERLDENINEYLSLFAREKDISNAYERFKELSIQSQQMLLQMQQYRQLEKNKRGIESIIENSKNRLNLQLEQKKEKYVELKEKISKLENIGKAIKDLEFQLKYFQDLQIKKEQVEEEGNLTKINLENKKMELKMAEETIKNNYEKIALLEKGVQDSCPLCHSPLDETKKGNIEITIKQDIEEHNRKIGRLEKEITSLTEKKETLQQKWKNIRTELSKKEDVQNSLHTYKLQLKDGERYSEEIKELEEEIKVLQSKAKGGDFAQEERKSLAEVEERIKNLNYSDKKYFEINQELEKLKTIPLQREKLLEAKKAIINLTREKTEIAKQLEIKGESINSLRKNHKKLKSGINRIDELQKNISFEQRELSQLQKEQNQLFQKKGASRERLLKIEQILLEKKEKEEKRDSLLYQKSIYEKLGTAFGKNGIPSMIIENAIPELEEEANAILTRLSDIPITVSFESLKELKSGEERETLDIRIHDEMGIRPYELYSGGEAFRIDFAIRIALSKLLTFRAGAPLRTLVIDEGFGTQDEEGLQKLIQAINTIQVDFDKIIVITHLSVLKDAFPARIEVWKDPVLGSRFELIHL